MDVVLIWSSKKDVLSAPRIFTHFQICRHFSFSNPIENRLEEKIRKRHRQNPKNKKVHLWPIFEPFLGNQNGHPELDMRAYVLAEVGAVIRKRGGERKKREIATQRELVMTQKFCIKLTCVYPYTWWVFGAKETGAMAHLKRFCRLFFRQLFQRCLVAQGGYIEKNKVGQPGTHFIFNWRNLKWRRFGVIFILQNG